MVEVSYDEFTLPYHDTLESTSKGTSTANKMIEFMNLDVKKVKEQYISTFPRFCCLLLVSSCH